jgi:type I restriction enzyme S subunit
MIRKEQLSPTWKRVLLRDAVEFLDYLRRPVTKIDRTDGQYPYYGANGQQGTIDDFIFDEPLILLAEDGGNFGQKGRTVAYKIEGKCWVNNHAHVLRPKPNVDINFLLRHLEYYDVTPYITGTTRGKLTKDAASRIELVLPPLPEQKRIAAILDKADSIRRKRKEAVRLTEELLRSVFLDMFGDPVTNPKGWKLKSFKDLLEIPLRNGLSPATGGQYSGRVLTLSAITGGCFDARAIQPAAFSKDLPTDKFVNPRDFLICRGNGNANLVGKGRFPLDEIENTLFPDTMIAARITPDKVIPEFLEMIWHTQLVRSQIDKGARTTNGTFKVNQGVLNAVKILCPPIEIQTNFSVIVKSAVRSKIINSTSFEYSETLFNALLQRAFHGELWS